MLLLISKFLLKIILGLILFVAAYLLIVFLLSLIPVNYRARQPKAGNTIFLTSDGIHIDVHVPVITSAYDWRNLLPPETFKSGDQPYNYITFGWGDWGFYLETPSWSELKASTALKAAFLRTPTVMHVSYLVDPPTITDSQKGKKIKQLVLSDQQMQILNEHILDSFKVDAYGHPMIIPDRGYGENDNFYFANGTYHLFQTCNNWVNQALKKAGVRTAVWAPSSYGVFRHLK